MHQALGRRVFQLVVIEMPIGVVADLMAGFRDLAGDGSVFLDLGSFHKKGGADVMRRQQLKNLRRDRPGTVVKSQRDDFIGGMAEK